MEEPGGGHGLCPGARAHASQGQRGLCLGSTPKSQDGTSITPERVFTNSEQFSNLASLPLVCRIVFSKSFFCALYFRIVFIALKF